MQLTLPSWKRRSRRNWLLKKEEVHAHAAVATLAGALDPVTGLPVDWEKLHYDAFKEEFTTYVKTGNHVKVPTDLYMSRLVQEMVELDLNPRQAAVANIMSLKRLFPTVETEKMQPAQPKRVEARGQDADSRRLPWHMPEAEHDCPARLVLEEQGDAVPRPVHARGCECGLRRRTGQG